jgi:hypothetical protein
MNNLNVSIFVESETQWIFNKTTCSILREKALNEINKTIYHLPRYKCFTLNH